MFRQEALDRLSSPEELDRLMKVASPRLWLALVGVIALLAAGAFWTIFTSIPTKVLAHGALARDAGGALQSVVFTTLQEGSQVHPGQSATVSIGHPGTGPTTVKADVSAVDPYPIDESQMLKVLRVPGYAHSLAVQQNIIEVRLNLNPPKRARLAPGMITAATIFVDHQSPIHLIIP